MPGSKSKEEKKEVSSGGDIYLYNGVEYTEADLKKQYGKDWKEAAAKLKKK
jgi:hypothetical protein